MKSIFATTFFTQTVDDGQTVIRYFATKNILAYAHLSPDDSSHFDDQMKLLTHESNQSPAHLGAVVKRLQATTAVIVVASGDQLTFATTGRGVLFALDESGVLHELGRGNFIARGSRDYASLMLTTADFESQVGGFEGLQYYLKTYSPGDLSQILGNFEKTQSPFGFLIASRQVARPESQIIEHDSATVDDESNTRDATQVSDENTEIPEEEVDVTITESSSLSESVDQIKVVEKVRHKMLLPRINISQVTSQFRRLKSIKALGAVALGITLLFATLAYTGKVDIYNPFGTNVRLDEVKNRVATNIAQARRMAVLDITKSASLIREAEDQLVALSGPQGQVPPSLTSTMRDVESAKSEILKVRPYVVSEHFDLELEARDAHITDTFFDQSDIYILDGDVGRVYIVSAETRSYKSLESAKLKNCTGVAVVAKNIYVMCPSGEGIYLLTDGSNKLVLQSDPRWDKPQDFVVFNTNIYVLDSGNRTIYKYQGIDEQTFGEVSGYLADYEEPSFPDGATSITIDGSLYAVTPAKIYKYFGGQKSEFKPTYPTSKLSISGFFTSEDIDVAYVLNSETHELYSLAKDGKYSHMWQSPDLAKARVIAATKTHVYILRGTKIYKLGL